MSPPRRPSRVKRVALASVDPKLWTALLIAGLSWWANNGKIEKETANREGDSAEVMAALADYETSIDSLRARIVALEKRRSRYVRAAAVSSNGEQVEKPGLARRFFAALWSPFRRENG